MMAFRIFTIPIRSSDNAIEELNRFMANHKVLSIDRRWVEQGSDSYWTLFVDYWESVGTGAGAGSASNTAPRARVDYQVLLSAEDFAVFLRLRNWRKETAQKLSVPVYTIFTNEQLAQLIRKRAQTKSDMESVLGVGDSRIGKYAEGVLAVLLTCWSERNETTSGSVAPIPGS